MAVTILNQLAANSPDDAVRRAQVANAQRIDPTDRFKTEDIEVEFGPKGNDGKRRRQPVRLRYAMDGTYLFAVYGGNPHWTALDRDEWDAAAKNAIEKFCATRDLQIKFGPRPEDGNRYNWMVEVARVIEYQESTVRALQAEAERRALAKADLQRQIGR